MEWLSTALDAFLHTDRYLLDLANAYGGWIYAILFLVIFVETGVVIMPFLPGDSLLFSIGMLAAAGELDVVRILTLLTVAAIVGDNVNYPIGRFIGPRVFTQRSRFFKHEYLLRTQQFYEKHGGKAVVLARFVPIVRTFAPFVAGVGRMQYPRFLAFDVFGGALWIWSFGLLGFFFGAQPIVKDNFGLAIVAVIVLSLLPVAFEAWRARAAEQRRARAS